MNEEEIEKLVRLNQRLSLVLGYAMGFIKTPVIKDGEIYLKYEWLVNAIENLLYLDKPLLPMP